MVESLLDALLALAGPSRFGWEAWHAALVLVAGSVPLLALVLRPARADSRR